MSQKPSRSLLLAVLGVVALATLAPAQEVVPVGKGSYAASPPPRVDPKKNVDSVQEVEKRQLYLVKDDDRPIPSNKWYQNLILKQYGTGLWAVPHVVNATNDGLEMFFPTKPRAGGTGMGTDNPVYITGKNFKPLDSRAKDWSDWAVSFRSFESDTRYMDVTLAEGMPFVWAEFTGIQPVIAFGSGGGKAVRSKNTPNFFDAAGKPLTLPATTDALGFTHEGRNYAVFAPTGTTFENAEGALNVTFSGKASFLVLAPLPEAKDIATFQKNAYAIPRDTRFSWNYDAKAGKVSTTWKVTTEALQGTERRVIQGWLPHHYRESTNNLAFNGINYTTLRGQLRCSVGDEFTITYPFAGILPNLPAPTAGLDDSRMKTYLLDGFANNKGGLGSDTYWGGKQLERYAQGAFIASQLKDDSLKPISDKLRAELENWFTFTPGETHHFFAYYPRRKGLVGFNPAYGSTHFSDVHFHYGYFTYAAGLFAQVDPTFIADYGDMVRLVAKAYANYDRTDKRFPFLRTFDIWRGHSFADGNGFPDGNNQESTSESINSWVGLILLGQALNDPEMTAAGVMGYSIETRATMEYWFNAYGDTFPKDYPHKAAGMLWCNGIVWGTWFSGDPAWIYGIQWIPSGPHSAFFDRYPDFIKNTYADFQREFELNEKKQKDKKPEYVMKTAEIKSRGGELGSYHLGFLMHADPAFVVSEIDKIYAEPGDKVARDPWMANIYYQAVALKELGRVDWTCHASSPTAMVYKNPESQTRTFIAWNPTGKPQTVEFFEGTKSLGKLEVAANGIARAATLKP